MRELILFAGRKGIESDRHSSWYISISVFMKRHFWEFLKKYWVLVINFILCHLYVDRVTGGVWPHDTFARPKVVGVHS